MLLIVEDHHMYPVYMCFCF